MRRKRKKLVVIDEGLDILRPEVGIVYIQGVLGKVEA